MTRRALIVMAKQPVAGQTKTRLSPPLSLAKAAQLYTCLLLDTLEVVRDVAGQLPLRPFIAYYPVTGKSDFQTLAPDFQLLAQQGHSLGERLSKLCPCWASRGTAWASACPGHCSRCRNRAMIR